MNSFERWMRRAQHRRNESPVLAEALFENRFSGYIWYRLNYFLVRFIAHLTIYLLEFFLLSMIFAESALIKAIIARSYLWVLSSFWWGGLEVFREKIRELVYGGRRHNVADELSKWLSLSAVLTGAFLIFSFITLFLMWADDTESQLLALYVFATNFRTALQFFTRTYHSGIYAIRRVFRPFWSILAVEITTFAITLLLWPFLNSYSFPIAAATSSVILSGITIWFVHRSYRVLDFMRFKISWRFISPQVFRAVFNKEFILGAVGGAIMKLESIAAIAISFLMTEGFTNLSTINFFYVLAPFLQASSTWANLFYFDFKKLEFPSLKGYDSVYKSIVIRLGFLIGFFFWLFYFAVSWMLPYSFNETLTFLFLPIFVVRSCLACAQVKAFTERRYFDLIFTALVFLAVVIGVVSPNISAYERIGGLTFGLLLIAAYLWFSSWLKFSRRPILNPLPFYNFMIQLRSLNLPVRCGIIRLNDDASSYDTVLAARKLASILALTGWASIGPRHTVLWAQLTEFKPLSISDLVLCGLAKEIPPVESLSSGSAAQEYFHRYLEDRDEIREPVCEMALSQPGNIFEVFRDLFPDGEIVKMNEKRHELPEKDFARRREFICAAFRYLTTLSPLDIGNGYFVSALVSASRLEVVFAIPKNAPRRQRRNWHRELRSINLARLRRI